MVTNILCRAAAVLLILSFATSRSFSQELLFMHNKTLDAEALVYATNAYGYYPGIQSFSQCHVITSNNYQYAVYYNKDRRVCLGRRALPSGAWESLVFTDYLFTTVDCHNVPVLGISADGRIHLSFDHHVSPLKYRVSVAGVANNPASYTWNESLFGAITDTLPGTGVPQTAVTYPAFIATPSGNLQLVLRLGNSGNGKERLFEYDTATGNWSDLGFFTSSAGTYTGPVTDGAHRNAYRDGMGYLGGSRLHFLFTWRETGDVQSEHDILYAYSDDEGRTWKNNAGVAFASTGTDLIGLADTVAVIYPLGQQHGLLNQEYMDVDRQGRVHAFKKHMLASEANATSWTDASNKSKTYHHMRNTSGAWSAQLLPFNSYRINMVADSSGTLYAVTGNNLDVWTATAASGYTNWALAYRHSQSGIYAGETIAIDRERMRTSNVLSVQVQEKYAASGQPSAIRTIEFGLSPEPAITLDNTTAEIAGAWNASSAVPDYYGVNYHVRASGGSGANYVKWRATIPVAGNYSVYVWLPDGLPSRATNAKYVVYHSGLNTTYYVDQTQPGGGWILLGTHAMTTLSTGNGVVMLTDEGDSQYVIADAVRFVRQPDSAGFRLAAAPPAPLLLSGKGQLQGIRLLWQAPPAEGNSSYQLLRSGDGKNFEVIGHILGTPSSLPQNYTYMDEKPLPAVNHYQLRQTNGGGIMKESSVISLDGAGLLRRLQLWATGTGEVHAIFEAPAASRAHMRIVDLLGRVLVNRVLEVQKGYNTYVLPSAALPKGVLIAELRIGGESRTLKFVKY